LGHAIEECPRDPNLKTVLINQIDKEQVRIQNIKTQKKCHADSKITTTIFLKNCVKVPKLIDLSDRHNQLIKSPKESKKSQNDHLFQRGAMRFDDFNYDAYNKHILVDQNVEPYNAQTMIDLDGFVP